MSYDNDKKTCIPVQAGCSVACLEWLRRKSVMGHRALAEALWPALNRILQKRLETSGGCRGKLLDCVLFAQFVED
ncbi:MAG: hypothetical protein ACOX6I_06295 [Syntrophomonadaceae bacterium]